MVWLLLILLTLTASLGGVVTSKVITQKQHDRGRKTYLLTFPTDLAEDRVVAWLTAISGSLNHSKTSRFFGVPTVAFETWATPTGITHRLKVPWKDADYIAGQLRTLVPGTNVIEDTGRPWITDWTRAIELHMTKPDRLLNVNNSKDLAASVLGSLQPLQQDEVVMLQWIISPALPEPMPSKDVYSRSTEVNLNVLLSGENLAKHDELEERRKKLMQPNLLAVGRIGAKASTKAHANHLIHKVEQSISASRSTTTYLHRHEAVNERKLFAKIDSAGAPVLFPAKLNVAELSALIAWPVGQPFVAGLAHGSTRHLAATEDVPRVGRVMGHSNYPGLERPIAQGYDFAIQHTYFGGKTGSGKSVMLSNLFAQDVANGYGAIVIDPSNSGSSESMFRRALSLIPEHRMDDVIVIDVADQSNPVGFNVLDQGGGRHMVDQITDLFTHLYSDTKGIWTRQLLFHSLYTLLERGGHTFVDLTTLIAPHTPEEVAWADDLRRSVKDPELRHFWGRWEAFAQAERNRYAEPVLNRVWQLISRPEMRYIIGQTKSSFQMADVLKNNKILLVSFAGVSPDTAQLLGLLMMNALWTSAQSMTPEKPNFVYLDEFQLMTRLPMGLDDMMARARKHKLGMNLATQHMADLPTEVRNAVINNARTRVIFQSSNQEARVWLPEFGRQYVDENDFVRIRRYEAIAQIATESGINTPVTLKALPPLMPLGLDPYIVGISRNKYGRPLAEVEAEIAARRVATPRTKKKPVNIGYKEWGT